MFDSLSDEKLRAAHDAAQLLYDNHRALGLDPSAIKLDTLRADIAMELENRGKPTTPAAGDAPAGARASRGKGQPGKGMSNPRRRGSRPGPLVAWHADPAGEVAPPRQGAAGTGPEQVFGHPVDGRAVPDPGGSGQLGAEQGR
jgi:hypothetical protein